MLCEGQGSTTLRKATHMHHGYGGLLPDARCGETAPTSATACQGLWALLSSSMFSHPLELKATGPVSLVFVGFMIILIAGFFIQIKIGMAK